MTSRGASRMGAVRAVLFDLGGTLYDYATLEPGNREALIELAREAGSNESAGVVIRAHRDAMRETFYDYLPKASYLHRDLFADALLGMAKRLEVSLDERLLERYRARQRSRNERDFRLRDGVHETLESLRSRGIHVSIVSNIDEDQLSHLTRLGDLDGRFDAMISSEAARSCKPHPRIFELALTSAGCAPEEALFVGDTRRQDIAGANGVGIRSVLLWHRDDRAPPDEDPRPDHVIRRIPELLDLVG